MTEIPVPDEATFEPQPQHEPARYVLDDQVREDVANLAICVVHDSGLTDTEVARLEGGEEMCVFALRLDDLDAAGVALVPAAQANERVDLVGVIIELGDALERTPTEDQTPQDFLRVCLDEVRSLRGQR